MKETFVYQTMNRRCWGTFDLESEVGLSVLSAVTEVRSVTLQKVSVLSPDSSRIAVFVGGCVLSMDMVGHDSRGNARRFPFGLPWTDNANYLWIQLFYSALNATGRAGFVMANSASDDRSSEQELRQKLIEARAVDVMVAVGPNMFYTVTLPCTLWFLNRRKARTKRADTVLFIDARHIYRQVDRAHRDWTPAQIGFIANLVRLYRGSIPGMIVKKYFRLLSVQNAGENFTPLCYHCEQRPCSHPGAPSGRELFLVKQFLPRPPVAA